MNRNFNDAYKEIYSIAEKEMKKTKEKRDISLVLLIFFNVMLCITLRKNIFMYLHNYMSLAVFIIILIIAFFIKSKKNKITLKGATILGFVIFYGYVLFALLPINQLKIILSSISKPAFIFAIASVITLIYFAIIDEKLNKIFKETVMKNLVKVYDDNFTYTYKAGVPFSLYKQAHFEKMIHEIEVEDLIRGSVLNDTLFSMSQVESFIIVEDEDGRSHKERCFKGLFGAAGFGDVICPQILITPNKRINRFSQERIEIDSAEFEKYYDILTEDKIAAMKILTSDVIDEINEFKKNTGNEIEIKILSGKIFFRIQCGEIFERLNKPDLLDFSEMYRYFCMIDGPVSIVCKIIENINNSKEEVYIE